MRMVHGFSGVLPGITSLICSRTMFAFIDDPEGPNLLVVVVVAAILYILSFVMTLFTLPITSNRRVLLMIFLQVVLAAGLYFFLR